MKNIKTSEHVLVAGMTGSGKSFLAEVYTAGFENCIVLDTKGLYEWLPAGEVDIFETLEELKKKYKKGLAIYRPIWEELNSDSYNSFFEYIYNRGNMVVVVDETMSLYESSSRILPFHNAIMTRGRQLNIGCWNLTQRPKNIPLVCISEATHFFIFDLNLETDRKRIYEIIEQKEILEKPSKLATQHSFWYYNVRLEKPILSRLKTKK